MLNKISTGFQTAFLSYALLEVAVSYVILCPLYLFTVDFIMYVPTNLYPEHHQNILYFQAQRDYFGAHQFERIENPGTFVHANWTGCGGSVASSTYQV